MKNIFISICFILNPFLSIAQFSGTLNYKLSVQSSYGTDEINFITYFSAKGSIEFGVPKYKNARTDTLAQTETQGAYKNILLGDSKRVPFLLKNFSQNKMILADNIMFKLYLVDDSLNNFNWKLTKEQQKISNYNCTKAKLNFRGRNYTAWFTESIPISLGPWKFGGLPGLIIKVSDEENKFVYELSGIDLKVKFDEKILNIPKAYQEDKPLSYKEFFGIYDAKVEHYKKMSRVLVSDANGSSGTNTVTLAEKQEKL